MNLLAIGAFLFAAVVFGFSVIMASDNPKSFLDMHGFVIVVAGTIACTAISFQLDRILLMFKVFIFRIIKFHKPNYRETIIELMKLAEAYRSNSANLTTMINSQKDPFIKEAMLLLTDGVIEVSILKNVLLDRVDTMYSRYSSDAKMFQGMGKFPPAMGLMGAVLGMISLLGGLGRPGAEKTVGHSMSVALIATFYGIAFANLLVIPIGENLAESSKELKIKNNIIVEGVMLIAYKTNPVVLGERLNSFLLPSERVDRKTVMAGKK